MKPTSQLALASVLIALGVAISFPFYIPMLTTKACPGQHIINALAGVLLGPLWAAFIATMIGLIRNMLGVGTIYAFPGGIPGGVVVGIVAKILRKANVRHVELAALSEPIGTLFIGATASVYLVAPLIGDTRITGMLIPLWFMWSFSTIPGAIIGFAVLRVLRLAGFIESASTK